MGGKVISYLEKLKSLKDWDDFLLAESGLPGPRGNLELAQAFADVGNENLIKKYISIRPEEAPVNSAKVFLTFCGVVGLGTLINRGKREYLPQLRVFASDPRWRIREAVAMALQRVGDADIDFLLQEMRDWSIGNLLEKRAAAAALCEPRLLTSEKVADAVLDILDEVTSSIVGFRDTKDEGLEVLKKGLAYCWSVAVAACPEKGKKLMEKWAGISDKTVAWIMKENLKKNRLLKMDNEWVLKQNKQMKAWPVRGLGMLTIRKATLEDLVAITEIYNEAILQTVATFDTEQKTIEEQTTWFVNHDSKHHIMVAEQDGLVVGWASLSKWSDRCAYSGTAEISLYVKKEHRRKGIGRKLLKQIVKEGQKNGLHTLIARITEGNEPSVNLFKHERFELVGVMKEVGRKFGKLLDVYLMQRIFES